MTGREIVARDNRPTIDLNLMRNQSTCLNASITLSKLPIMMQKQIRATNMRWGGATLKILQPCLVPIPNITICHSWLSHYDCQTEMWWPNLDDWREIYKREPINKPLELDVKSINLSQCINNFFQTSNHDANTNPSNQYEMRRDNLKKFATLSCANAEYYYSPQLTFTLWLLNSNVMTKFWQLEEKSCKRSPSNNWLDLDKKSVDLHWKW